MQTSAFYLIRAKFKALALFSFLLFIEIDAAKVLIHVPVKVKHHHHTHTVFKHVHHTVPVHHEDIHVIHDHHDHHHHHEPHFHDDYRDFRENFEVLGGLGGVGAGVVDLTSFGKESFENLTNQKRVEPPTRQYGPPKRFSKRLKRKPSNREGRSGDGIWMGYDSQDEPFIPLDLTPPSMISESNLHMKKLNRKFKRGG